MIVNRQLVNAKYFRFIKNYCSLTFVPKNDEYTEKPEYPKILDLSRKEVRKREKISEYDEIKAVKTVEEKQIKLNMPKYYGFKCFLFNDHNVNHNDLELIQHVTRTNLQKVGQKLPTFYDNIEIDIDSFKQNIKAQLEEALLLEHLGYENPNENFSTRILKHINRIFYNNLGPDFQHICEIQTEYNPRIESFWFAGGPTRQASDVKAENLNAVDRAIQFSGKPDITLRHKLPLKPLHSLDEISSNDYSVPLFKFNPRVLKTNTNFLHATNLPGYFAGDVHNYPVLSFHNLNFLTERNFEDPNEAICRQGILSSFSWLNALANFHGFNSFNDITHPLVTQSVFSDGKQLTFFVYQLNTLTIHGTNIYTNEKRNVCWATDPMPIYESIDAENGQIVGFNEAIIDVLLKLYANKPEKRLGINMTPFLNSDETLIADYEDPEKRTWLDREYKFLTANRPRYKLDYEIYLWERIYKIQHKQRPLEKRMRPFETFKNPYDRKLNERQANYIPRALRPDLPRHKGRYAKEFWP